MKLKSLIICSAIVGCSITSSANADVRKIGARSHVTANGCHDESKGFKIPIPDAGNLDTSYQGKLAGIEVREGGNGTHENKNWAFADGGASLVFELYAKGGGHWVDPPKVFGAKIGGGGCEGATGADSFVDIFGHYK